MCHYKSNGAQVAMHWEIKMFLLKRPWIFALILTGLIFTAKFMARRRETDFIWCKMMPIIFWSIITIIRPDYLKLRPIEIPVLYERLKDDQLCINAPPISVCSANTSPLYNARISNNLNFRFQIKNMSSKHLMYQRIFFKQATLSEICDCVHISRIYY